MGNYPWINLIRKYTIRERKLNKIASIGWETYFKYRKINLTLIKDNVYSVTVNTSQI